MTRGDGGEPTREVSPDNRFWRVVGGKRPQGGDPPGSIPPAEVIPIPAFQATGRRMLGSGWAPQPRSTAAAALAPGWRAIWGGQGRGEEHRGEDYPWTQPVPFSLHLTIKQ